VFYLYVARVLAGLAGGGVFVLIPLYVSEISDDSIRGSLGAIFILCVNMGTLVLFVAGAYLNYYLVAAIMAFFPIIFFISFIFLPETPQYLIRCKDMTVRCQPTAI
jgi:MFS family permease